MGKKEELEDLVRKLTSVSKKREEMLEEAEEIIRNWLSDLQKAKKLLKELAQKRELTPAEMLDLGNTIMETKLLEKVLRTKKEERKDE